MLVRHARAANQFVKLSSTRLSNRRSVQLVMGTREVGGHMDSGEASSGVKNTIRRLVPERAQRMIDDGILEELEQDPTRGIHMLNRYFDGCSKPADRHEVKTSFQMIQKLREMVVKNCLTCLYLKSRCICDVVRVVEPRNKLWLFQTLGEYGRRSNSGSLLCQVAGARRTLRGIRAQENELVEFLHDHKDSSVVLFPSPKSVSLSTLRREQGSRGVNKKGLTIVVLDGTPNEAANMERFLPQEVPRIHLGAIPRKSWLNSIREQSEETRVCTAQGKAWGGTRVGAEGGVRRVCAGTNQSV